MMSLFVFAVTAVLLKNSMNWSMGGMSSFSFFSHSY
jgi:hypothetical protein